jgi:diguanylate cyclase (GGDEF)-like protein
VAVLVALLSWAAVSAGDAGDSVALWWPAAGVAVAGVVTAAHGWRAWVVLLVLVSSALGNVAAGRPLLVAALFGLSNALEAAVAGWWLLRDSSARPTLVSIPDIGRVLVAAALGSAVIAVGATMTVVVVSGGSAWPTFLHVLASHASAVLLITPLALIQPRQRGEAGRGEVIAQVTVLATTTLIIFSTEPRLSLAFLLLPPLLWAAIRLPLRAATWEVSIALMAALSLTAFGWGPLSEWGEQLLGADWPEGSLTEFVLTQVFVMSTWLVVLSLAITVSQRRALLTQVRRSERVLRGGFEDSLLGTVILEANDQDLTVVEINPVAAELLGANDGDVIVWQDALGPASTTVVAALRDVAHGRRSSWRAEVELHTGAPTMRWAELVASDLSEEPGLLVMQLSETTARKAVERELEHRAVHDALTGLPNRTLLRDRVERAVAASDRSGSGVAVLVLDLDSFQVVNDTAGHEVGDEILRLVADRLVRSVRQGDTVARLGGDEFAVVLPGADEATVTASVTRLRAAFDKPFTVSAGTYRVGVSIGVAISEPDTTFDELLRDADTAVHTAKAQGRGQAMWFDPSFHDKVVHAAELTTQFEGAIDRGEVVLFAQPIVDLGGGGLVAAEALVRWQHPARGLLAPGAWLGIINTGATGTRLESWILQQSCQALARWSEDMGDACPRLHVNVSTTLLRHGDLDQQVLNALQEAGAPSSRLVIELTETDLESVRGSLTGELQALRSAGVRIAVDDFGTGFSTLARLARIPLDELKIDQSFTASMLTDPRSDAIVTAIIGLARALDLAIIAEGVETEAQASHLLSLGCDCGQGYLWSRPKPIGEVLS